MHVEEICLLNIICAYCIVDFKGGIDDLSWVDVNVFKVVHQSLLLILWLDFNLLASLSKYDFLDDLSSVVVSFLSFLYLSQ